MIKNKLVSPILQTLFVLMTEADEEDEDEDEDEQVESSKPYIVAAQTLNEMALHLPPDKVITPLLQWAEPAFKGKECCFFSQVVNNIKSLDFHRS